MSEILFRGKAINRNKGYHRTEYKNGDWVYGLLTRHYDERFENLPAEMTDTSGISGIEIDYETIGQFTGLSDKNGTKIFEGDIVNFKTTAYNFKNCRIKYQSCYARYCAIDSYGYEYPMDKIFEYEVIGNIHDNPELLKGECKK